MTAFEHLPTEVRPDVGQFNVFRREEFHGPLARPIPYTRGEFFKVTYLVGRGRVTYADQVVETGTRSLLFSNPQLPYRWESLGGGQGGFFCVFTKTFFDRFGPLAEYPVFAPGYHKVFDVTEGDAPKVEAVFQRMFDEIASDYLYRYDVLRLLVLDLVHQAMKAYAPVGTLTESNAARRLAGRFAELLERQFPLESPSQRLLLRAPSEFAEALGVHVNHLNRSLREATGRSTSEAIAERLAQEARLLLQRTTWNVAEIAYALGYQDPSHFIQFFRRHFGKTPRQFRDSV